MKDKQLHKLSLALFRYVVGTEGNVSRRTKDGFLIKASGKSFYDNDFVECDSRGQSLDKPSMEAGFHADLYNLLNCEFIAHTHPINTLKILCGPRLNEFANNRLFPDHVVFNGTKACVVPYATPGSELRREILCSVARHQSENGIWPNLYLLQNHGIICCGQTAKEVTVMTEICEKAAAIFISFKDLNFLTPEQIQKIVNNDAEIYRQNNLR